jgi:hypothetical protein
MADQFFTAFVEAVSKESLLERAEHAVEHVVEEAAHEVAHVAHEAEERVEEAAVRGWLGGPYMWGLIALAVVIIAIIIVSS